MRVFLDANILFSASNSTSPSARVIHQLLKRAEVVTCEYACEEARRNVDLKRPAWREGFDALIPRIEVAPTQVFALPITLAPKDVPILCSAVRSNCSYLVTNDKQDFGHLHGQTVHGVTIITLLQLAQILADSNPEF